MQDRSPIRWTPIPRRAWTLATALILCAGTGRVAVAQCGDLEEQKFVATTQGSPGDWYGGEVALDGDVAAVTALFDDAKAVDCGTAYLLRRDPVTGLWVEEQRIRAQDRADGDGFGSNITVSGDWVAVGAAYEDHGGLTDVGAVYLFHHNGLRWVEKQKLIPSNGTDNQIFGSFLAMDGDVLAVGQYSANGAVHIYRRDPVSDTWILEAFFADPVGTTWLGVGVDVSGNRVIAGAPFDDDKGYHAGAAWVYRYDGSQWNVEQKLLGSNSAPRDEFGAEVALDGNVAVVGSPLSEAPGTNSGSAYVFRHDGTSWLEEQQLTASDGAPFDALGARVALRGDVVVVGSFYADIPVGPNLYADAGAAWVYRFDGSSWIEERKLLRTDPAAGDAAGCVALSGETVLMGAVWDDDLGTDSGSVYSYEIPPLGLTAVPDTVVQGDTLTLTTFPGVEGLPAFLAVIDVNGSPTFLKVDVGPFDVDCQRVHVTAVVPPGLAGNVVTFQSYGFAMGGGLLATDPAGVTFQ